MAWYEWVFSGVGATILAIIITFFVKKQKKPELDQSQNSGTINQQFINGNGKGVINNGPSVNINKD